MRPGIPFVFLAAFALYVSTLHPAFPTDDSPETVAVAVNLGIQHAPGYPLATILGRIAAELPVGGACFRLNLLAAALGAAVAALCASLVGTLFPTPAGRIAGILAALILAVSRLFWENSVSAKGAIYQLNLLLVLGSMRCLLGGTRDGLPAFFLLGLATAGHWMSAVLWIPAAAWLGRPWTARRTALAILLMVPGLTLYLQLPFSAIREPSWGDPVTARDLANLVLRRGFLPHAAIKDSSLAWLQTGWGLLFPVREAGIPFLLLALAGAAALWRSRRTAFLALAGGALVTVAAVSILANPVHIPTGEYILWLTDRFFLPYQAVAAVMAGAGLLLVRNAAPSRAAFAVWPAAVALVAGLLIMHAPRNDHSRDYLGWDYAENLRVGIDRPAVFLAEADYQCFPLLVPMYVEDREPGMTFVTTNPFLNRRWGWRSLARRMPDARNIFARTPEGRIIILADRLATGRAVYHFPVCTYPALRRRLAGHGLVSRYFPGSGPVTPENPADLDRIFRRFRLRGLLSGMPFKDESAWSVLDEYCLTRGRTGEAAMRAGRTATAIEMLHAALRIPGRLGRAYLLNQLGHACAGTGRYAEAEAAFREAAGIKPRDLDLWTNVATAAAAQGRLVEASRWFEFVLKRNPAHAAALANVARLKAMRI
jgi:hypothetical protein